VKRSWIPAASIRELSEDVVGDATLIAYDWRCLPFRGNSFKGPCCRVCLVRLPLNHRGHGSCGSWCWLEDHSLTGFAVHDDGQGRFKM
jgi:hypothetical protein